MAKLAITLLLAAVCQLVVCAQIETIAKLNIISRADWGAKPPTEPANNFPNTPSYVVIHHSATDGCTTEAICKARLRSFQDYHMNKNKWNDIGYNFVVGQDGNIYEGTGWKVGTHTANFNSKSVGICVIGTFTNHDPNPAALTAVKNLISHGVDIGKISSNYKLLGHRQLKQTLCPGESFYRTIQTWPNWAENP